MPSGERALIFGDERESAMAPTVPAPTLQITRGGSETFQHARCGTKRYSSRRVNLLYGCGEKWRSKRKNRRNMALFSKSCIWSNLDHFLAKCSPNGIKMTARKFCTVLIKKVYGVKSSIYRVDNAFSMKSRPFVHFIKNKFGRRISTIWLPCQLFLSGTVQNFLAVIMIPNKLHLIKKWPRFLQI